MGGNGPAIIAAISALAGTILGACLNAFWSRLNERAKWERERPDKHNAERVKAYVDFMTESKEMTVRGWSLIEAGKYSELTAMSAKLTTTYQTVYLLATKPVQAAARNVSECMGSDTTGIPAL